MSTLNLIHLGGRWEAGIWFCRNTIGTHAVTQTKQVFRSPARLDHGKVSQKLAKPHINSEKKKKK